MAKRQLFEKEIEVLRFNREFAENKELDIDSIRNKYLSFCEHYEELLDQSKLITKVSDKLQNKLNTAHNNLATKNNELQETINELTRARVGRKAATITFVIFISIFVFEELFMDKVIEQLSGKNVWLGALFKLVMALLLKPIEGFIEKLLLEKVNKKEKELKINQEPLIENN